MGLALIDARVSSEISNDCDRLFFSSVSFRSTLAHDLATSNVPDVLEVWTGFAFRSYFTFPV